LLAVRFAEHAFVLFRPSDQRVVATRDFVVHFSWRNQPSRVREFSQPSPQSLEYIRRVDSLMQVYQSTGVNDVTGRAAV
jgi:hypothetical protein